MNLDGALGEAEELGDIPVGLALGHQFEHPPLGRGELETLGKGLAGAAVAVAVVADGRGVGG